MSKFRNCYVDFLYQVDSYLYIGYIIRIIFVIQYMILFVPFIWPRGYEDILINSATENEQSKTKKNTDQHNIIQ